MSSASHLHTTEALLISASSDSSIAITIAVIEVAVIVEASAAITLTTTRDSTAIAFKNHQCYPSETCLHVASAASFVPRAYSAPSIAATPYAV